MTSKLADHYYNPSDSRVECFGFDLAIRNRDIETLKYLWDSHMHKWNVSHLSYIIDRVL